MFIKYIEHGEIIIYYMKTLDMQKEGVVFEIENVFCANKRFLNRLLELGFVPGQKVEIFKKSILGKVFIVKIRDGLLSIRKHLLKFVSVK